MARNPQRHPLQLALARPDPRFPLVHGFWQDLERDARTPAKPLFGESALKGEPLKIGAPHFVDFGKNMEHSPDGKAYLTGHGASVGPEGRRFAYNSWMTGDEIHLVRVTPSIETINDVSKYEFFAGHDASGKPQWSRDFKAIKPLAGWKDNMGCVTMTYNAPLKKHFMCVTDGGNTVDYFNTYILESDLVTGPWKLVTYLKHFGQQAISSTSRPSSSARTAARCGYVIRPTSPPAGARRTFNRGRKAANMRCACRR